MSCEKILAAAREQKADIIGLSGLITPSLDEMAHVAREMEREGMKLPLLIGGATTSKAHTAVKIAPGYSEPVVHVLDASRAVPVVSNLISAEHKPKFANDIREEYARLRSHHAGSQQKLVTIEAARANAPKLKFDTLAKPDFTGIRTLSPRNTQNETRVTLSDLVPLIDWSPFFHTWELRGVYPGILNHEKHGEEARKLFCGGAGAVAKNGQPKTDRTARCLRIIPGQSHR